MGASKFKKTRGAVALALRARKDQPLENPAFVIANWGRTDASISLKLNGQTKDGYVHAID